MYIEVKKDKAPYYKELSDDKIINLTGESGSGKSYFVKNYDREKYVVIDTDEVFAKFDEAVGDSRLFGEYLRDKYEVLPDILNDGFDTFYKEVVDFFMDSGRTLVIDSAQFRNIKDVHLLKGQLIVMRTSVDKCYDRCIKRWKKSKKNNYTEEELEKYMEKKKGVYSWYKKLNEFLERVDVL